MTTPRQIVATGELLWDMLPAGKRLGGTTGNFAIGCARLGRPSTLVTCIGDDPLGQEALETLRNQAAGAPFDESLVQVTAEAPTGTVDVALNAHGQPVYTIGAPAAWDRIQPVDEALAAARSATALCFGTLAQRDQPSRNSIRALVTATPPDCVRVLDINVRLPYCNAEVIHWSLAHATIAKISDEELAYVTSLLPGDTPVSADSDIPTLTRAAHAVLAFAPAVQLVAITLGPRGSLLVTRTASDSHPGFPITVADTVGAGDAFCAGLTHAYLAGAPLAAINTVGNLCGSYVASQAGATPPFSPTLLDRVAQALA